MTAAAETHKEGFTHPVPDAKARGFKVLTQEQVEHFMKYGYVALRGAVPPESIKRFTEDVWVRLGMDPEDKNTWTREELHNPHHRQVHMSELAPIVWDAVGDLLGGHDRIDYKTALMGDGFIANMGNPSYDPDEVIRPQDLKGPWHVDGDWFRHFLDSECQCLETLVLWSDVEDRAGPTYVCIDGVAKVAGWLKERPEGSIDMSEPEGSGQRVTPGIVKTCNVFHTLTGKAGDVFLCHPLMPHSRSVNHKRNFRIITNPCVCLKEPYNFNRPNENDYSLVELKTLQALNTDSLDFKITRPRYRFRPSTKARSDALIPEQLERMRAHAEKTGVAVESMHTKGVYYWQAKVRGLPEDD